MVNFKTKINLKPQHMHHMNDSFSIEVFVQPAKYKGSFLCHTYCFQIRQLLLQNYLYNKEIEKLSNTCDMFVASLTWCSISAKRLFRDLRICSQLVEHHTQSPIHKFKMLAVWPSIAEGFLLQTSHEHFTSI